ncbi:MAG: hypothetical protein ABW006_14535 [Hyphomicrobium sp.]
MASEIGARCGSIACHEIEVIRCGEAVAYVESGVIEQRHVGKEADTLQIDADARVQVVRELGIAIVDVGRGSRDTLLAQFQVHEADTAADEWRNGAEEAIVRKGNVDVTIDVTLERARVAEGIDPRNTSAIDGVSVNRRAAVTKFQFDARGDERYGAKIVTSADRAIETCVIIRGDRVPEKRKRTYRPGN